MLRGLGWIALATGSAAWLASLLWPHELAEAPMWRSLANWAAFMVDVGRFHWTISLVVLAGLAWLIGAARLLRAVIVVAILTAWPVYVMAWSFVRPSPAPAGGAPVLTVLSVNLMYGRSDPALVLRQVRETNADVVVFQEWTPEIERQLAPALRVTHANGTMIARDDAFGSALFTRLPLIGQARNYPSAGRWSVPMANATVLFGGREVDVVSVHVLPPVSHAYVREQRAQVRQLAELARAQLAAGRAMIFAGDFNATPETAHVAAMLDAGTDETHRAAGRGRGTTWPAIGAMSLLPGIRLDHVFFAGGLRCVETAVLDSGGSDHRPITAKFVWSDAAPAKQTSPGH